MLLIPYLTDCSTPVNFSIVYNTTKTDISTIHIRWSNLLDMNFTIMLIFPQNLEMIEKQYQQITCILFSCQELEFHIILVPTAATI